MAVTGLTILAVASIAGAAYQGEQQKKIAEKANKLQKQAMTDATASATSEMRQQMAERARLNRKRPNVDDMLAGEQAAMSRGAGSTMLTGAGGASAAGSTSNSSLLGG